MTDGQTHRQTDPQTDAREKTICLPTLAGGDIIYGPLCTSQNNLKNAFIHGRLRLSLASAQYDVSLHCAFAGYQMGFADSACSDT